MFFTFQLIPSGVATANQLSLIHTGGFVEILCRMPFQIPKDPRQIKLIARPGKQAQVSCMTVNWAVNPTNWAIINLLFMSYKHFVEFDIVDILLSLAF